VQLESPRDILDLSAGHSISKRNLFDLIQFSKQEGSTYWGGEAHRINNTPQQGINWIGDPPDVKGVIIKARPGSYAHDGWLDAGEEAYRYSFKARKGVVNHDELANRVLIDQPLQFYPVFLFTDAGGAWKFEGQFSVVELAAEFVVLRRNARPPVESPELEGIAWREGRRRYVTHLLAERSRALVDYLKTRSEPVCDICGYSASARYGVPVLDAHHRTPISSWTEDHAVTIDDIALVCPNCHRAVHAYMRQSDAGYDAIRLNIRELLSKTT
jgi:putative restriction endonuclease